jgi:pimeloyl-ACP methyl ester carboxylesterase
MPARTEARFVTAPQRLRPNANGMTFGVLAWGEPDAPLAMLVHGYPDSAWTWRHLGPHLARRGWRVIAPFSRGYGPSDLAPDDSYLAAPQSHDIIALHAALGGDERAVLIGHDWGAIATYGVTMLRPECFSKYITLAVPPPRALVKLFGRAKTLRTGMRQARLSWYFIYNQLPLSERGLDRVIPKLWRDWSPVYDAERDLAFVFDALSGPGRRRAALRYYRNNLQRGLKAMFSIAPKAPVLYLHGEQDGCVQAEIVSLVPDGLPAGSRHERLPNVGHFLHLEDPERLNGLVDEWIEVPR